MLLEPCAKGNTRGTDWSFCGSLAKTQAQRLDSYWEVLQFYKSSEREIETFVP